MTLAQRELLAAAKRVVDTSLPSAFMIDWARAQARLKVAIAAVEAEDDAELPSVDLPAFLRRQAE